MMALFLMSASTHAIGSLLDGRYRIESLLGKGGFGVVYKATQLSTHQPVAIKVLHPERIGGGNAEMEIARFQREMSLIAKLHHPNIVRLLDSGQSEEGQLFTVLEYVDGNELGDYIKEHGPLAPRLARKLMLQVLDALSSAHEQGIVHRDLKPANIMVTSAGARRNAMVLDFGIGAVVEGQRDKDYKTLTAAGQFHGTPLYMAPEQLRGKPIDPRIDIYAWGLVFFEILTGERGVDGDSLADIVSNHLNREPIKLPSGLRSHPLGQIILKATAKDADMRYLNAEEALNDLEECVVTDDLIISGSFPSGLAAIDTSENRVPSLNTHPGALHEARTLAGPISGQHEMPPAKSPAGLIAIVVLALLVGGGLVWFLTQGNDSATPPDNKPGETSKTTAPPPETSPTAVPAVADVEEETEETPPEPQYTTGTIVTPPGTRGPEMVFVEGGTFEVGGTDALIAEQRKACERFVPLKYCVEATFAKQRPAFEAELEGLFVDRTEVTNAHYQACLDAGSCSPRNYQTCALIDPKTGLFPEGTLNEKQAEQLKETIGVPPMLPASCVTQAQAEAFCTWAGKKLPSEPEWELAASGGTSRLFPWTGDFDAKNANGADETLSKTFKWKGKGPIALHTDVEDGNAFSAQVGSYPSGRSPEGVFDLAGNVQEWTSGELATYPLDEGSTPPEEKLAPVRGGSWSSIGPWLGTRARSGLEPETLRTDLGFRCVLPLSQMETP